MCGKKEARRVKRPGATNTNYSNYKRNTITPPIVLEAFLAGPGCELLSQSDVIMSEYRLGGVNTLNYNN